MILAPIEAVCALFIIVFLSQFWLNNPASRVIGCVSIGYVLTLFNFQDIDQYTLHYNAFAESEIYEFKNILEVWNFEIGYSALVFLFSRLVSFEIYYVTVISLSLLCYYYFFRIYSPKILKLSFIIFLSFFLYYIAFSLRATIASALIAGALILIRHNKINASSMVIFLAWSIHLLSLPAFIILIACQYRSFFEGKIFAVCISMIILMQLFVINTVLYLLPEQKYLLLKLDAYNDLQDIKFSVMLLIWVAIGLALFAKIFFRDKDISWLYFLISIQFAAWSFNSFFLGRAMWFYSYIFAFIISFITYDLLYKYKMLRIIYFALPLGVFSFLRFN